MHTLITLARLTISFAKFGFFTVTKQGMTPSFKVAGIRNLVNFENLLDDRRGFKRFPLLFDFFARQPQRPKLQVTLSRAKRSLPGLGSGSMQ
ncbi:hypothetical protein [Paraburkholderia sp. RL17-337-BIB-A]|uniref:hypothetical protein n=1 Tax=Paraburkholderia sp. RL17-337-BIB-A TaxID=3031636 RepID=UPI0038B6FC7C